MEGEETVPLKEVSPEPENVAAETAEDRPSPGNNSFLGLVQKVQRYSSYSFSGFLGLHAASMVIAPLISIPVADSTMSFSNAIYQAPAIEPILVYGSLTAHIISGMILRGHKIYLSKKHYDRWKVSLSPVAVSGYVLFPLVVGHLAFARLAPQYILGDSSLVNLQYVAHIFHKHRLIGWTAFIPLIFLTFHHTIWGWKKWLLLYGRKYTAKTYTMFFSSLLAAYISLARISRMPETTGWLASQFNKVLAVFFL
jgi:hypothetical protein